jgi:hypothetical protein
MAGWLHAEDVLGGEGFQTLDALGPTEMLVCVYGANQARSVAQVVEAAVKGVSGGLAGRASAVLVLDAGVGGDTAETTQAWARAHPPVPPVRGLRVPGPPVRGRAVLAALAAARYLEAGVCLLVDAGLVSLSPEGVENLIHPLLDGEADHVSPAFSHAPSEGALTTNLLAPLCRALYGRRLQQLVGACAGLSGGSLARLLEAEPWAGDLAGYGLEIRLAIEALTSGGRVVEAHLGRKVLDPGPAPADLATILTYTVGPFFALMDRYRAAWSASRGSAPVPAVGSPAVLLPEVGETQIDRMVRAFKLGLKDLLPVWEQAMPEDTLGQLYPLALLAPEEFLFPADLWARIIADFALAHHEHRLPRDHLLRALTPLYLGRTAAFLREAQTAPPGRVTAILDTLGRAFEAEKPRLDARWR